MCYFVGDVVVVIKSFGCDKVIVVGYDWGGVVVWQVVLNLLDMVENLIIFNFLYLNGMGCEFVNNFEQQKNSGYVCKFQEGSVLDLDIFFGMLMNVVMFFGWVIDVDVCKFYQEVFGCFDFDVMFVYYKENYIGIGGGVELLKVKMFVLQFYGFEDMVLYLDGFNNIWDWFEKDLILVIVLGVGYFVQQDVFEMVSMMMFWWLKVCLK